MQLLGSRHASQSRHVAVRDLFAASKRMIIMLQISEMLPKYDGVPSQVQLKVRALAAGHASWPKH